MEAKKSTIACQTESEGFQPLKPNKQRKNDKVENTEMLSFYDSTSE